MSAPVPPGYDIDAAAALIRHLYVDLGQAAGGPLHVELDDGNVDDEFLTDRKDRYTWLFDGSFERYAQAGDDVSLAHRLAIRDNCEQILRIFRRLTVEDRHAAISAADPMIEEGFKALKANRAWKPEDPR